MVGANWSREELAAMTRAWREALEVPPRRGFRLLEHMFQRFTELRGGTTGRTVGSMEIKRKYMKNMAEVISRYTSLQQQNEIPGEAGRSVGSALPPLTPRSGISAPQAQLPWFQMQRGERKKWFLRLNTKSYKFANVDEETFSDVERLMQIERVLHGTESIPDEDAPEFEDDDDEVEAEQGDQDDDDNDEQYASSIASHSSIRVPLVRSNSDGEWEVTRQFRAEEDSRSTTPDPAYPRSSTRAVEFRAPTPVRQRRDIDAFDRLITSSSRRGDAVMIDAGPWDDDSESESEGSIDNDDEDAYNWRQAKHMTSLHFERQRDGAAGVDQSRRRRAPAHSGFDTLVSASNADIVATTSGTRSEHQEPQSDAPAFVRAVQDLKAQAAELKDTLIQEREARRQEEQQWDSAMQRRERERQQVTGLVARMGSSEADERREEAEIQATRDEVLALVQSEKEARCEDGEVMRVEQEEEKQFMEEIKRDCDDRKRFDEALKAARDDEAAFVQMLQQDESKRHRRVAERMEIVKRIKLIRDEDQAPRKVASAALATQQGNEKREAAPVAAEPVGESTPPRQDTAPRRPVRKSSKTQLTEHTGILSPLRTRSGRRG